MANINGCINTKQANEWRDAYRARKGGKKQNVRNVVKKIEADESLEIAVKKEDIEAVQEGQRNHGKEISASVPFLFPLNLLAHY